MDGVLPTCFSFPDLCRPPLMLLHGRKRDTHMLEFTFRWRASMLTGLCQQTCWQGAYCSTPQTLVLFQREDTPAQRPCTLPLVPHKQICQQDVFHLSQTTCGCPSFYMVHQSDSVAEFAHEFSRDHSCGNLSRRSAEPLHVVEWPALGTQSRTAAITDFALEGCASSTPRMANTLICTSDSPQPSNHELFSIYPRINLIVQMRTSRCGPSNKQSETCMEPLNFHLTTSVTIWRLQRWREVHDFHESLNMVSPRFETFLCPNSAFSSFLISLRDTSASPGGSASTSRSMSV